jgi:hypothetical protein
VTLVRIDVVRSVAGRLSGRLVTDDGTTDADFDGTLELLRLLENVAAGPTIIDADAAE